MSEPRRMPPSISTVASGADLVAHLDERVERGDGAVDLPAAVIGDDDPVDAVVECEPGVLGREDALDDDRQLCPLAQPGEVGPGQREVRERGERHQRRRLHVLLGRRVQPLAEEGIAEELRQPFAAEEREVAVPEVAVAPAERERVERDHDRAVARRAGAVDEAAGQLAVAPPVELEPALRVAELHGDVLERGRGGAREDHRHAGRLRGARDAELGVGMHDREHADRGEQERRRRAQPEHLDREVALGVAGEHPRPQAAPLERLAVGPDRRLRARAAGDVVERSLLQPVAGACLPVLGRERPLGSAGEVDRVLDLASRVQHCADSR